MFTYCICDAVRIKCISSLVRAHLCWKPEPPSLQIVRSIAFTKHLSRIYRRFAFPINTECAHASRVPLQWAFRHTSRVHYITINRFVCQYAYTCSKHRKLTASASHSRTSPTARFLFFTLRACSCSHVRGFLDLLHKCVRNWMHALLCMLVKCLRLCGKPQLGDPSCQ